MTGSRVFLFQKDNAVIPDAYSPDEILDGVDEEAVREAFPEAALDRYELWRPDRKERCLCALVGGGVSLPARWTAYPVRKLITAMGNDGGGERVIRLVRAAHIMQWRALSVFCGVCGAKQGDAPEETARLCPVCGHIEYPRIAPAVIVAITNDEDEILLAHNRLFPAGMFSLIAGFNEAGETLEETVLRETFEECALLVRDIRYAASQPWPFPSSLMTGWTARYASGEIRCDGVEIEEARWFSRDNLPALPGLGSIARRLINQWRFASN